LRRCVALALLLAACLGSEASASGCDPIGTGNCLFPWPNDYFREHGHLALTPSMMPSNSAGVPIDPSDYNRMDGFSPGATIVLKVPGLDSAAALAQTGAVPITDLARTYDSKAPIVVINARTGHRHLIWAELDSNAGSAAKTALLIHPAKNFREGERYIVALRRLRNADGELLDAPLAFRFYRDRAKTPNPAFERRRPHMEDIFRRLKGAGIKRKSLYLAWDFTVASERSLSRRMLSIRDRAFAELGDRDLSDLKVEGAPRAT
jgi:hypothetical protein